MRLSYFSQRSWENGPNLSPAADLCTKQSDASSLKHQQPSCLTLTPDQMTPDGTRARTRPRLWLYGTTRRVSSNAVVLQQRCNAHGGFSPSLWRCACKSRPLQSLIVLILRCPSVCPRPAASSLHWAGEASRDRRGETWRTAEACGRLLSSWPFGECDMKSRTQMKSLISCFLHPSSDSGWQTLDFVLITRVCRSSECRLF